MSRRDLSGNNTHHLAASTLSVQGDAIVIPVPGKLHVPVNRSGIQSCILPCSLNTSLRECTIYARAEQRTRDIFKQYLISADDSHLNGCWRKCLTKHSCRNWRVFARLRLQGICNLSSSCGLLPSRCSAAGMLHSGYVRLNVFSGAYRETQLGVGCHANYKGAHRAIPQRKSSYRGSS
jgi:hypothetical protein